MSREFFVDTPLGKLRVYSKTEVDVAEDYPGVYIDIATDDGGSELLACVEFNSSNEKLQTCVYGDGENDVPTHVIEHRNLELITG